MKLGSGSNGIMLIMKKDTDTNNNNKLKISCEK